MFYEYLDNLVFTTNLWVIFTQMGCNYPINTLFFLRVAINFLQQSIKIETVRGKQQNIFLHNVDHILQSTKKQIYVL